MTDERLLNYINFVLRDQYIMCKDDKDYKEYANDCKNLIDNPNGVTDIWELLTDPSYDWAQEYINKNECCCEGLYDAIVDAIIDIINADKF